MYQTLADIALTEFGDFIERAQFIGRRAAVPLKLGLHLRDGTVVDIWLSPHFDRYAYHREQRATRGLIHKHDKAPDHPEISTFPKHFHAGLEHTVVES